jgi:excisionase family DNA binding protein
MSDPERDRRDPEQGDRRKLMTRVGGRRATDPVADWLSISDFAVRYGIDRSTVYKWLGEALLETYRVGSLLRIKNLPPDKHVPPPGAAPIVDPCGPASKL